MVGVNSGGGAARSGRPFGSIVDSHIYALCFFLIGVGMFLLWRVEDGPGAFWKPVTTMITRSGWVAAPLSLAAIYLLVITVQHVTYRVRGEALPDPLSGRLAKVEMLSEKLGFLGTASGIIAALTADYLGMSEAAAQVAKNEAIGIALYSTVYGVVLGLIAGMQRRVDGEGKREVRALLAMAHREREAVEAQDEGR
jgi:hypothetical protein